MPEVTEKETQLLGTICVALNRAEVEATKERRAVIMESFIIVYLQNIFSVATLLAFALVPYFAQLFLKVV